MHKFIFLLGTGVATFVIGILPSFLTGQPNNRDDHEIRSCQVKQVRPDGRIVWTPCDEWVEKSEDRQLELDY
ncbi:MAG: hypothetical protein HOP17_13610 [Acidobacteria bacterium]|nr:hypothetical protein [Acidobacteriota bacterium]